MKAHLDLLFLSDRDPILSSDSSFPVNVDANIFVPVTLCICPKASHVVPGFLCCKCKLAMRYVIRVVQLVAIW